MCRIRVGHRWGQWVRQGVEAGDREQREKTGKEEARRNRQRGAERRKA